MGISDTQSKVTASHLQRDAYLYVRQSTMRQVVENSESAVRQYDLRGRAVDETDDGEQGTDALDHVSRLTSRFTSTLEVYSMPLSVGREPRGNARAGVRAPATARPRRSS